MSLVLAVLLSLLLVTFTHSAAIPDSVRSRHKRQSADVRTAEYLAWIALGGKVPSRGCEMVACGVVDVYSSGKRKRSGGDSEVTDTDRYNLIRALLTKAAMESTAA